MRNSEVPENGAPRRPASRNGDRNGLTQPPSVTLPKGGGAIRGLDEKFTANPVTGTGTMSVPIALSPGRSGFGPQISLSYDSGAGNGPFGLGWTPGLPSIARKTDKGLPRYRDDQDADDPDVFILSGAEDLVPVPDYDSEEEPPEALPDRIVDRRPYEIQRFRPRTEGLFARIERWTDLTDKENVFWRSISKDNVTTWYGRSSNSRIADPSDLTRIFSWLICERYDDKGNVIVYGYESDEFANVDRSQLHEANRSETSRLANRTIKRIRYGNHTPFFPKLSESNPWPKPPDSHTSDGSANWFFEVVFDFGDHQLTNPVPNETLTWDVRTDPFSSHRSGFEVRTYRLCQRVLMFHHFPDHDQVQANCLVRSTDFTYRHEQDTADARNPIHSVLTSVRQIGYERDSNGGYRKRSLPPLEFEYSEAELNDKVQDLDSQSLENLPYGLDNGLYQWVDLEGEGLSGVLTEQMTGWFYKSNLSPLKFRDEDGRRIAMADFGTLEQVRERPSIAALSRGRQRLLDLAGDGQLDLVGLEETTPGFYERTHDERWHSFAPFKSLPILDWNSPSLRFVDLTGDGRADILVSDENSFCWYPSLAEAGFGSPIRVPKAPNEEEGPRIDFDDGTQSIYLADLSGDGLTDLVRIRNGEVCYWPNLGYGHFGAKITMGNSPWFDTPDHFDQRRIRLADFDGSGVTDIIYLGRDAIHLYYNQSGNSWSKPRRLSTFPAVDNLSDILAVDLLGTGTACLVWSSPLPADARRTMRYIDLMGGHKPHLLVRAVNNLGAETVIHYASSTKFYLNDSRQGRPWVTKIPFPVHVVERIETFDWISRNRFITRYAYHHGYFDGVEREFRGFGMVEQWDTESFAVLTEGGGLPEATNFDEASHMPPVLTKTWFHTGAYLGGADISWQFAKDYYGAPRQDNPDYAAKFKEFLDTLLPGVEVDPDWSPEEEFSACRALRGSLLRQEVYGLDSTAEQDHPYMITEQSTTARRVQAKADSHHAVFFTYVRETINYHYERNPADPRIAHTLALEVDKFGNVLKSATVGYGRKAENITLIEPWDREKQTMPFITYTEDSFTNPIGETKQDRDFNRTPLPSESVAFELTGLKLDNDKVRFSLIDVLNAAESASKIEYEEAPNESLQKRTIEHLRTFYRPDDFGAALGNVDALLPLGTLEPLALPGENYQLTFTPGLLSETFLREPEGQPTQNLLPDPSTVLPVGSTGQSADRGGHVDLGNDGHWWIPSGRAYFHADGNATAIQEQNQVINYFYLPRRFRDPFGNNVIARYDQHNLLLLETGDAIGNKVTAGLRGQQGDITNGNDYRVLRPALVMDPNLTISEVRFDALGLVVGTAVYKGSVGDSFADFSSELSALEREDFFANPKVEAAPRLGTATTRIIYDLDRFHRTRDENPADPTKWAPTWVAVLARETHTSDPAPPAGLKVQVSFSYSDGFGREVQQKIQAEPGPVPQRDAEGRIVVGPDGQPEMTDDDSEPRWVGSGWTIFNNKGKPVRKYEPFFSDTHDVDHDARIGVSPVLFYDPVERIVATLHPNHTYEKVVFDAWQQETWDVNDTINLDSRSDPDVSHYVSQYLASQSADWETWLQQRIDPQNPPPETPSLGPEQAVAVQALSHSGTATRAHLDVQGRTFLIEANAGASGLIETRVEMDIEGNRRATIDDRGNAVMRYDYDMLGNPIKHVGMDANVRWTLNDVTGKQIRAWDSRGHVFRTELDELRRPRHLFVKGTDGDHSDPRTLGGEILYEKIDYGDTQDEPENRNLRGQVYRAWDSAGVVTNVEYDFKGNLLSSERQLLQDYKGLANWAQSPALEPAVYTASTTYDALDRPVSQIVPDGSIYRPKYNEANLLDQVDVNLRGATNATPFVTDIDYDAKGRRKLIAYGNGTVTTYDYDKETFRLIRLNTTRVADDIQLQDLRYTYDPAGNITYIRDNAQQTIYFNNAVVEPQASYSYDPLYRLTKATGREHVGQTPNDQPQLKPHNDFNDSARGNLAHPHDGQAMRTYTEFYEYDTVGNIKSLEHDANGGSWTRHYDYEVTSNRLRTTSLPLDSSHSDAAALPTRYQHDVHGNMTKMPHLEAMAWDFEDQLYSSQRQVVTGGGTAERTFYVYDAAGQRVRKITENAAAEGGTPARANERIYLGGFEIYREFNGNGSTVKLERETLHVTDDTRRIALVETQTQGSDGSPVQLQRYQCGNHLGSASLELDQNGNIISYEEYHPFGSTAYQAGPNAAEVSRKRYRYTGKERDEETGLYYHGARYYAPWLGRWASADPIGIEDTLNLYAYVANNPLILVDPNGQDGCSCDSDDPIAITFKVEPGKDKAISERLDTTASYVIGHEMKNELRNYFGIATIYTKEKNGVHKLELDTSREAIESAEKSFKMTVRSTLRRKYGKGTSEKEINAEVEKIWNGMKDARTEILKMFRAELNVRLTNSHKGATIEYALTETKGKNFIMLNPFSWLNEESENSGRFHETLTGKEVPSGKSKEVKPAKDSPLPELRMGPTLMLLHEYDGHYSSWSIADKEQPIVERIDKLIEAHPGIAQRKKYDNYRSDLDVRTFEKDGKTYYLSNTANFETGLLPKRPSSQDKKKD